ncbi:MAG: ATP-binding cassette domain-containing protein [Pseudomonadota bacterium]
METANAAAELVRGDAITHRFGRRQVLDAVDFVVSRDEIVSLIGPNGAGKSTLLKILLGLIAPTAGRITRAAPLRLGYVPQHIPTDPVLPITVARMMTLTSKSPVAAQKRALERVGAHHLVDAAMHELSGGERQRVMLAKALQNAPDLLVLDEPTQGIDHRGEAEMYQLIADLRDEQHLGVVVVSHNLHLVMAATDRVVCLDQHVCCAGAPQQVSQHPSYTELFGPLEPGGVAVFQHDVAHHATHAHDN